MTTEIVAKAPAELALVRQTAYETALESFTEKNSMFKDSDQAVLMAEADLALDKPKGERTAREKALVHLSDTMMVMGNAVEKNLVTTQADAELLTDAMIYGSVSPIGAIKYLKKSGHSALERPLTPKELAGAITLHQDFAYYDESVSIATLARIADMVGVSLAGEIDEHDTNLILSSLERYDGSVDLHVVVDDPEDGPVAARKKRNIIGSTVVARSKAGVNAMYDDDTTVGAQRVAGFAEFAGIEDQGDVEDMYQVPEQN